MIAELQFKPLLFPPIHDKGTAVCKPMKNINNFLAEWRIKFNIPGTALDELLSELRAHGYSDLPKSTKTIMKTSRPVECYNVGDGIYCHTGIRRTLFACLSVLKKSRQSIPEILVLDINIDGVNYSRSTNNSLWLIQMSIRGVDLNPCVVGTYYGNSNLMKNCISLNVGFVMIPPQIALSEPRKDMPGIIVASNVNKKV